MSKESKYSADIYHDYTPSFYWIKNKKIFVEFEKLDDEEKRIKDLELEELDPEITNHEEFLKAIHTWTQREMTLSEWKSFETERMDNVLLLDLHICVNDRQKEFDLNLRCIYPGQFGVWCSQLLNKINKCEMMKSEPEIVCV